MAERTSAALPLDGIRVIDLSQLILGPAATQMLGDYGADVIKVERPGIGDLSRNAVRGDIAGQNHPLFCAFNRNKRSITLDLGKEEDRAALKWLCRDADILVHNFRYGVMERWGLTYKEVAAINPRLIYASGSGFGLQGPLRAKGGQDTVIQAMTGAISRRAGDNDPLSIPSTTTADYAAAMHLVQGILLALLYRARSGAGQQVDVCLFDSMIAAQSIEATTHLMRGREHNFASLPVRGVFDSKSGPFVMIAGWNPRALEKFCKAVGDEEICSEPAYATWELQKLNRQSLHARMQDLFLTNTREHWEEVLERAGILCAPVETLGDCLDGPQVASNELIWTIETAVETVKVVRPPIRHSELTARLDRAPPRLGEHNADILSSACLPLRPPGAS